MRELERAGHRFRTRCDTEVLVHGYEQWGAGLWERLRGMFAVAVWDARGGGSCSRATASGSSRCTTATPAASWRSRPSSTRCRSGEIDLDALEAFLAFNSIPAPLSIFREIRKLPPGHMLTWEDGRAATRAVRAHRPAAGARTTTTRRSCVEECRARLRDSVRAHLIADVPVGVLLSGGVDSGALAALAAEESSEAVRTFSIGFEEASFDELAGARAVAERYGTIHRELVLRPDAALLLPALAEAFDEPFADSSALPTYLVSKLAAEDVKVALSGEGGDELFGGYYTYVADLLAERVGPLAPLARPLVERLPTSTRQASFDYKAKRFARAAHLPPLERHHGWKEIFSRRRARRADRARAARSTRSDLPRALRRDGGARAADAPAGRRLRPLPRRRPARRRPTARRWRGRSRRACRSWTPSSSNFAFSLPVRHKVRGLSKKRLLRKAVEPLLPHEVVHGRKRGFSIPAAAWLRGELEPFARETLVAETIRRQGYLQPEAVDARARRSRRRPRGSLAPALGPARVHALVRAPRRGRAARRRQLGGAWSR